MSKRKRRPPYDNPEIKKEMKEQEVSIEIDDYRTLTNLFWASPMMSLFSGDVFYPDDGLYVPLTKESVPECIELAKKGNTRVMDFLCSHNPDQSFINIWDSFFSEVFHCFILDYLVFTIHKAIPDADIALAAQSLWDSMVEEGYAELAMDCLYDDFENPELLTHFVELIQEEDE